MLDAWREYFKKPSHIQVDTNGRFPRILKYAFPDSWPKTKEENEQYEFERNEKGRELLSEGLTEMSANDEMYEFDIDEDIPF